MPRRGTPPHAASHTRAEERRRCARPACAGRASGLQKLQRGNRTLARAWRGCGAGYRLQFGMSDAGVARAWHRHGAGMSGSPRRWLHRPSLLGWLGWLHKPLFSVFNDKYRKDTIPMTSFLSSKTKRRFTCDTAVMGERTC
eukprot:gene9170-biopygen21209